MPPFIVYSVISLQLLRMELRFIGLSVSYLFSYISCSSSPLHADGRMRGMLINTGEGTLTLNDSSGQSPPLSAVDLSPGGPEFGPKVLFTETRCIKT